MKFALPLLLLTSFSILNCGCDTLANRRSLYSPKQNDDAYWTRTLDEGTWKERSLPAEEKERAEYKRQRLWGDPQPKRPTP